MTFPDNLRYTKEHEWIRLEGDTGMVGITEYAQGELGDVVFVELPAIGKKVKQGGTFGTIEAVKAVSDLYAPVSGEVVEINPKLDKNSELVNSQPYGDGWMIKIKLSNREETKALLDAAAYKDLIGKK
ncbi:MAG TPA: glycine cleavage system protein GcvH [Bacteroidota bacterium]|nr:glycine cleavage system protein GcvH [Bacteroidota bacterium]